MTRIRNPFPYRKIAKCVRIEHFARAIGLLGIFFATNCGLSQEISRGFGREYRREGHNLLIHVDPRWVGCKLGGYVPIRIAIHNSAPEKTVTVRFDPKRDNLPSVEKTIRLPQNENVNVTLLIPVVGFGQYGTLEFVENGKILDTLSSSIELSVFETELSNLPVCLAISEEFVNTDAFVKGIRDIARKSVNFERQSYPGYADPQNIMDLLSLSPLMLPTNWMGYSGVDIVAISSPVLSKLNSSEKQAILKWTQSGGTLIVYDNGKTASESEELNRMLFENESKISQSWVPADLRIRRSVGLYRRSTFLKWPQDEGVFQQHQYLLGRVFVFRENPFPGTKEEWSWFMSTLDPLASRWSERMGLSSRNYSDDFHTFRIPGIDSVPVYAYLILISLFTILIGPLNYAILWKRKKLFLLIVSIPAIAFVTSLTLFGYSIVSNGLGVKTRVHSVTVVDQRTQTSVTTGRIALYAGMPPSGGLVFSSDTAVYPLWPGDRPFESGHVKWTDRQIFESGWLRSRTRTQFVTVTHRKERGRLEFENVTDDILTVSNGFEFDISHIIVSDDKGNLFGSTNFDKGARVDFSKTDKEFLDHFLQAVNQHDYRNNERRFSTGRNYAPGYGQYDFRRSSLSLSFQKNNAENKIRKILAQLRKKKRLPPRMYFAMLKDNPGVDTGVVIAEEIDGLHLVVGYY